MYTKVFRQIYDGTLADNWQALVTFQQLLVLADEAGVVDMTIGAIHRKTGIPVDVLTAGIAILEAPDPASRTPDMEGRRIARMDEHRDWGWFLVNFMKYRQLVSKDEKRQADRSRISNQRAKVENAKYVYFAVDGMIVKIGCSANPWARVKEFRTSNPRIELALVMPGSFDIERQLHQQFKALHHDGEWFRYEGELRSYVVARSNDEPNDVADVAHAEAYPEAEAALKERASLRSASSSADAADRSSDQVEKPEAGKPKLELVPPSTAPAVAKAERLRQVTREAIDSFNAALGKPNGLLPSVSLKVGIEKRCTQVRRCLRVARQICAELFQSDRITREFWDAYFGQCAGDEHKSGRLGGGPGHENWLPSFEYLTREEVMLGMFDKATSEVAA